MNFRGNSEDHQFVGKVLGIYRGRTSSGYFDGLSDGPILGSSDEMFLGIFIGNFRGTEPSENSEKGVPREDGHDRAVEPTPQHSSLPEDPNEQERVQQREREEQEREMEREMYGRSCGAKRNLESGWNPETGSPYHHDHDAVEAGSDHH
ncbi:hypothetical protein F2Q69_00022088 [Brassica cretica]|uniref:Uncharacterized protein n=2 Tax=Brassica cretica TaxID=69181 RepID=A0A8S9PXY1_BRACR|nr:hypothetical protein F2Q69_00022088 [Brassica cretica]